MYAETVLNRLVLLGPADPIRIISSNSKAKLERAYGAYPFEQFVIETRKAYKEVFVISLSIFVDEIWTHEDGNLTVVLIPQRKRARYYSLDMFKREISQIQSELKRINPDLVHGHWSYEYGLAAAKSSFPHLITAHDSPFTILKFYRNLYRLIMVIIAIRVRIHSKNFVFVSEYLRKKWKLHFITHDGYPVINNFSNIQSQKTSTKKVTKVISVGDSSRRKNIKTLLFAWKLVQEKHENAILMLVGPGLAKGEHLNQWANKKLKLTNVQWHGTVSREELSRLLTESTIMCHPSLEESQGLSLIEAMALEIPTISGKKSGGNLETVGSSGMLVDVRKPELIANSINCLLEDTKLQSRLSTLGRTRYIDMFEPSKIISQYELEYQNVLLKWNNE